MRRQERKSRRKSWKGRPKLQKNKDWSREGKGGWTLGETRPHVKTHKDKSFHPAEDPR